MLRILWKEGGFPVPLSQMEPFDGGLPTLDHSTDDETASPVSPSNYSSCDLSDFDKYCSANSFLGTASVCSSVANRSDILDSFRSLGLDEDLENCGGGGGKAGTLRRGPARSGDVTESDRFNFSSDGTSDSHLDNGSFEGNNFLRSLDVLPDIKMGSSSLLSFNEDHGGKISSNTENGYLKKSLPFQHNSDNGGSHGNCDGTSSHCAGPSEEKNVSSKLDLQEVIPEQHDQKGFFPDVEEIDSGRGYLDDEDDMLDSGTDDEAQIQSCQRANVHLDKVTNNQTVSPFLMGNAVAFGDNDWDDFEQETAGDSSIPLAFVPIYGVKSFLQSDDEQVPMESITSEQSVISTAQGTDQEVIAKNIASFNSDDLSTEGKGHCVSNALKGKDASAGDNIMKDTWAYGSNDDHEGCFVVEESQLVFGEDVADSNAEHDPKKYGKTKFSPFSLQNSMSVGFIPTEALKFKESGNSRDHESVAVQPLVEKGDDSIEIHEKAVVVDEIEKLGADESFDDMVLEMEEILLNSEQSLRTRNVHDVVQDTSQHSLDIRDGRSTACTSSANDACSLGQFSVKIDWVEVVGAKQKRGDVSFGERLIGVKEYTVYRLRVWSGKDLWEVEHRYRDFFSLYCQMKKIFSGYGLRLPSPWSKVDQESRKIFGNASPHVASERSSLIQDCLQSILTLGTPFGIPRPFVTFLTAPKNLADLPNDPPLSSQMSIDDMQSHSYCGESGDSHTENFSLGKTISLILELKIHKSVGQLLEEQCYTCAGCHIRLDSEKSLMQEFVQTLLWGKPRLCEYTGQLFCTKCHINDTAVLPARILHHWDFSLHPVSQLAKAYLESIYDQPMLCVSAVNPFLFSKVPALRHITDIRKKIGSMLPYVRCPFSRSIQRGLGSRNYLLQSNDFFAVRDLVDLSKGAFAALPHMVQNISRKIVHHISQECLECYDVGVPCAAEACKDPASLILPFQEDETARCSSCGSLFHRRCFVRLQHCPCSKLDSTTDAKRVSSDGRNLEDTELNSITNLQIQKTNVGSSTGFFSDIFSKAIPEKLWKQGNNHPVILMSSVLSD